MIGPDLFGQPSFSTIAMDPPWPERGGGRVKRGADRHYGLLDPPEILAVIRASGMFLPAEHAHLWCWYTDNYLPAALWLVGELGFAFKRTFQWVKVKGKPCALDFETGLAVEVGPECEPELRYGIGQYARGAHEGMLFATRGKGMDPSVCTEHRDVPSVILAPVPAENGKRIHSCKPPAAYELIERRSRGPYLEMFARTGRPAWTAWGDEAPGS
ncbi:MAG TPA: MT-A70 family methyltransferase [Gemmatimonadales bacterium]|nr:MT-A70 family methyltransferase [Gemmatimonadales bacterium]